MRKQAYLLAFLAVLAAVALLIGCARLLRPTPTPTPKPSPTATLAPRTPVVSPQPQVVPRGYPSPVPCLYKFFDNGTDFQKLHPEYGPVGSIHYNDWEHINPGPGAYNWARIDDQLALEAPLRVTLPNGQVVPKPVVIQVHTAQSDYYNWEGVFYDCTPPWVYDQIDAQNPNNPRPVVYGRKVGHAIYGCNKVSAIPMYDSPIWREAFATMVRALGERYNNHPQVTAVDICTGLDGETAIGKDWYCDWDTLIDQQAPGVRYRFNNWIYDAMAIYREAFPDKPIFIMNAAGGPGILAATSDYASEFTPPIGVKNNSMWIDKDSHQGYGDYVGSFDKIAAYSMTMPIWLESMFGLGDKEGRYWSLIAGLHYHPDGMDLHDPYFSPDGIIAEHLRFANDHIGVNIGNTPSVWTVLRDAEFPLKTWNNGRSGCSGHMGDWTFWLYRNEYAPQSATQIVLRANMPVAKNAIYSRQTRRTKQDQNHIFMSFDIDDQYPYVAQKPVDVEGGNVYYNIYVTILNYGTDTFSLQYRNWDGQIVSQTRRKGAELGAVNDWVVVPFLVRDGYLNNNMPGNTDFRISCEHDGDEYIHMVRVVGGWGIPPTPTPTSRYSRTPTPSLTPGPGEPAVPATATPTPTRPTEMPPVTGGTRFEPVEDTYIDRWEPAQKFYDSYKLSARQGDVKAPLMRFDLSSIPAGDAIIEGATLYVYVIARTNQGSMDIAAHRVLRPWKERQATWERALDSQPWAAPGCNDTTQDRAPLAVDATELDAENRWFTLDVTTLVQEWVRNPAANYGLILKASGGVSVQYDLASSNHGNSALRPYLQVAWRSGTPTPTASPSPPTDTPTYTPTIPPPPGPTQIRIRGEGIPGGMDDTYISAWAEDTNYYASNRLCVRQGAIQAPLFRFDLSMIPTYATVKSAVLSLYTVWRSNPHALGVAVVRINRDWEASQVTWNHTTASETWSLPGAGDTVRDRSATIYTSGDLEAIDQWTQWDLTQLVQEWVSAPERNDGLLMLGEGGVSVQYDFASSNWQDDNLRPYLDIVYVAYPPTPTPTPTHTPTATPSPTVTPLPATGQYVFQQGLNGYTGCADAFIDRWNPQTNNAASPSLIVRQGGVRSTLIRYALEAVPRSSRVRQALLSLYVYSLSGDHGLGLVAYRVLRPWVAEQATYQRASHELPWAAEGASQGGTDIAAEPVARYDLRGTAQWVTLDITSLAQEWIVNPESNLGLVIKGEGGVSIEYVFLSSEHLGDISLRPKLYVNWEAIPATPTATGIPTILRPSATATGIPTIPPPTATGIPTISPPTATATGIPTILRPTATATFTPVAVSEGKLTLQQGLNAYEGASDTFIDAWSQQTNAGDWARLVLRNGEVRHILMRFDISRLPSDANLTRAYLGLWVVARSSPDPITLEVYMLRRPWSEGQATWIEANMGTLWAAPGANGTPDDREATLLTLAEINAVNAWAVLDLTSAVRAWQRRPDENYGVLIKGAGAVAVDYEFASSQWATLGQRPKLVLDFERPYPGPPVQISQLAARRNNLLQGLGISTGALAALIVLLRLRPPSRKGRGDKDRAN